jgi:hypothetical protein
VGHSERRKVFSETDGDFSKTIKKVFAAGMIPILCVGELKEVPWQFLFFSIDIELLIDVKYQTHRNLSLVFAAKPLPFNWQRA